MLGGVKHQVIENGGYGDFCACEERFSDLYRYVCMVFFCVCCVCFGAHIELCVLSVPFALTCLVHLHQLDI
jgi:hypothetical protein